MKRILTLLITVLCLAGCETKYPEPDVSKEGQSAYIKINNESGYVPFLFLDGDIIGFSDKGMSTLEVFPVFCNKPGRFSVVYDIKTKLEYVIGQDITFQNGAVYGLTIRNDKCVFVCWEK